MDGTGGSQAGRLVPYDSERVQSDGGEVLARGGVERRRHGDMPGDARRCVRRHLDGPRDARRDGRERRDGQLPRGYVRHGCDERARRDDHRSRDVRERIHRCTYGRNEDCQHGSHCQVWFRYGEARWRHGLHDDFDWRGYCRPAERHGRHAGADAHGRRHLREERRGHAHSGQ